MCDAGNEREVSPFALHFERFHASARGIESIARSFDHFVVYRRSLSSGAGLGTEKLNSILDTKLFERDMHEDHKKTT